MRMGAVLVLMACSLGLSGCLGGSQSRGPLALASPAASSPSTGGAVVASTRDEDATAPLADEAADFGNPRPDRIVAVRGGDIMIPTDAERAERRRQLAALKQEIAKQTLQVPGAAKP